MIEVPTDEQLIELYDKNLAATLLKYARVEDNVCAGEYSIQISKWAIRTAAILRTELDFEHNPKTRDVRDELKTIPLQVQKFSSLLTSLSEDATNALCRSLSNIGEPDVSEVPQSNLKHNLARMAQGKVMLGNLIDHLDRLVPASTAAAQEWHGFKKMDGPVLRWNSVRKDAVEDLAGCWQCLTGNQPTRLIRGADHTARGTPYGPFQDFVVAALEPLFGKDAASTGIDDVIKDVIASMGIS